MDERMYQLIQIVLNGESFRAADRKLGFCKNGSRTAFQRWIRKINPELYDKGIRHDAYDNYVTPPLEYLRKNKDRFLNRRPCLQPKSIKGAIMLLEKNGYTVRKVRQ